MTTDLIKENVERILEMKRAQKKKKCSCMVSEESKQVFGDKETDLYNKRLRAVKEIGKKKNSVKLPSGDTFVPEPEIDEKDTVLKYQEANY